MTAWLTITFGRSFGGIEIVEAPYGTGVRVPFASEESARVAIAEMITAVQMDPKVIQGEVIRDNDQPV